MAISFNPFDVLSGFNLTKLNQNFQNIKTALSDGLSRSGQTPNQMEADIDLNSNDLLNVGTIDAERIVVDGETVQIVDLATALKISNALSELTPVATTARTNIDAASGAQGAKADTALQPDIHEHVSITGAFDLESLGPTSPPNGIFFGVGGNSLSFQTLISNPTGGADIDNQRGSMLLAATTSDDGNSEEQTLCVLTTIETGVAKTWTTNTPYLLGDNVRIDSVNAVYRCITAGTSAPSGTGPSGTGTDIIDGTVHWMWINDAAISAKVGIYNEAVAKAGGGSAWAQANNIEFETGYTGTFGVNTEFDTTNDAVDVGLGGTNLHNLYVQSNGKRITSVIDVGSSNPSTKAAFWGLHFTGANLAERAVICVDANAPIGLGFGDGAGGVVTTTYTDAVIKDNSNAPVGLKLDGTYDTAQIAGLDFIVTPIGNVSARGFQTQFHAPASSSDTGSPGEIRYDINFIYVCTGINTWKRVALSSY